MLERAWSLYISFQNYNIQEGIGKVIYKPVLLLPETKGSCAHMLLITACVSDYVHMNKLCRLRTEETHAKLLAKSTVRDL